jgi:hypothetical protein
MNSFTRTFWVTLFALCGMACSLASGTPSATFALDKRTAGLTTLDLGAGVFPLGSGGGFAITDIGAKRSLPLRGGVLRSGSEGQTFSATADDVAIRATFVVKGDVIEVSGELETKGQSPRALLVRYVVPVGTKGSIFSNTLSQARKLTEESQELGTIFPIAAITGDKWGVALSIPPDFPCCFGLTGTKDGLGIEFYLGTSPDVKAFPNRARFRFVIDRAAPGWGFRSALARYYERYPDYYRARYPGAGFWNWNDPGGLDDPQSIANEALPFYKAHGLTRGTLFDKQVERNRKFGVVSFAYTIVGMRELTGLPKLPPDYEGAMKVFREFEEGWKSEGQDGPMHKQHASNSERNRELLSQIVSSTVEEADGRKRLRLRNTVWGASSITFIMNPNPDLFKDRTPAVPTVGSVTLEMLREWLGDPKVPGVHMDSLGSQWPSCVNYSAEQRKYARYPLTFDKSGRVVLHNMISHYEFLEEVRALAHQHNKFVFGNGLDIYESRNLTEHYNGLKNGRFFHAATLDMAGREITHDFMNRERLEAVRTYMGPKLMTAILYHWRDQDVVRQQMNRGLVYNIFTSPNRFFEDKISYLTAPDGFARDRELLAWFSKNARMLDSAGWQPVTHARVDAQEVACERYGTGDVVYFAVVNLGEAPIDAVITVNMAELGMAPGDGASSSFAEVARGAKIRAATDGNDGKVRVHLIPNEAQIVKLTRTW